MPKRKKAPLCGPRKVIYLTFLGPHRGAFLRLGIFSTSMAIRRIFWGHFFGDFLVNFGKKGGPRGPRIFFFNPRSAQTTAFFCYFFFIQKSPPDKMPDGKITKKKYQISQKHHKRPRLYRTIQFSLIFISGPFPVHYRSISISSQKWHRSYPFESLPPCVVI